MIVVLTCLLQMSRTRRSLRDSQHNSPEGSDEEDLRSPVSERGGSLSPTISRGRMGKSEGGSGDADEDGDAMDVIH